MITAGIFIFVLGVIANMIINKKKIKLNSAYNIHFAKFTFENESGETRRKIDELAKNILKGRTSEQHMVATFKENNPRIVFGFYALAMSELGIEPALPHFPNWFEVRNPFIASLDIRKELIKAKKDIERKTHVNYDHWID
ncbi:hypothetical protein SOD10_50080 [Serratia plymuthica]|uniref:Uncharacterized protein n=2 Tax=Serratia plymuthica TaxID=82996 RepID=S4YWZ5_SERPL|nr:hypothetical protein M621_15380 [Serratia plymuthica S13]KYG13982.1 hypothetical protein SOD10_50080 [Serratia plymuthica]